MQLATRVCATLSPMTSSDCPGFAGLRACVAADEHAAQVDGGCAYRVHHDQRVAAVFVAAAAANLAVYADGNRVADGDDLHARAACRAPGRRERCPRR